MPWESTHTTRGRDERSACDAARLARSTWKKKGHAASVAFQSAPSELRTRCRRRRRTCAAGSIPGRTPAGPASDGTARWFPCRTLSSSWSFRRAPGATRRAAAGRDARLALQPLHRFGSFLKFLSAKKSCSPAVQMNSVPQSTQCSDLVLELHRSYLSPTRARPRPRPLLEQCHGHGPLVPDRHDPSSSGPRCQSSS